MKTLNIPSCYRKSKDIPIMPPELALRLHSLAQTTPISNIFSLFHRCLTMEVLLYKNGHGTAFDISAFSTKCCISDNVMHCVFEPHLHLKNFHLRWG